MILYRIIWQKLHIIISIGLLLTACGSAQTPVPTPTATAEPVATSPVTPTSEPPAFDESPVPTSAAVVLTAAPVNTLDPYLMVLLSSEGSVAAHLWDTLVRLNNNLKLEPGLAESWQLINDLTWELKLRSGVTFQNGEAFDAEAVRFSIERARSMPGSLKTFATDAELDSVEIVDDYTIWLHTEEPVTNLPYYLSSLEILPPVYYGQMSPSELALSQVGSGPYRFVERQRDDSIVLEAVPEYWDGPPAIDRLTFKSLADASQRLAALTAGQADLVTDLTPAQAAAWDPSVGRLETIESTRRMFIGLRAEDGTPLADKRVRQALNYGIDVNAIAESILGGYGQRYGSWVNPPNNNADLAPWPFDIEKARQLLTEAGYSQGFSTTLDTPVGRYYQDQAIAQAIVEQLDRLNIKVEVHSYDWPTYVEDYLLPRRTSPLFLLGLSSRANGLEDASNLSYSFPYNPTGWQNREFEQLLKKAHGEFNDQQLQDWLNQAQVIAYEEAPWIWLWRQYDFYGVNNNLAWQPRADGLIYLYRPVTPTGQASP